ncbi:hypothetical protein B0H17DRAFT_1129969 [Mycena rosella]|uniref:Uncharacterized protein n=1 Tax=Mycena rosella TaxID=1033263 RepID=A0AAD7DRG3_MYCRO|nr:hypothetical protein B0H17DRAFT_1129969 [Mycena rosella]
MLGDELGSIRHGLQTVQRQLKDIKKAATTRNEKIYLEMDMLGQRMQENRDLRLEDFRDGQENVGALRKEMRSEIELVQDELRTIQTRLQNWIRQETQVMKQDSAGDRSTRKKRALMPLLTKKQRKVLERPEMALQQPRRSPNRKDRHGKRAKQRNMDEPNTRTNAMLEGSRCTETECSEDSELLRRDLVDIAQEKQAV